MTHAQNKTQPTQISVSDFLSHIKDEHHRKDAQKLCQLMSQITGQTPKMWAISKQFLE